jgi:hypothetical protein
MNDDRLFRKSIPGKATNPRSGTGFPMIENRAAFGLRGFSLPAPGGFYAQTGLAAMLPEAENQRRRIRKRRSLPTSPFSFC